MSTLHIRRNVTLAGSLGLLIIIGIIAGVIWHSHGENSPTNGDHIVVVRELGIRMTVPDSIKDLKYTIFTTPLNDGGLATVAGFSTATLTARDPGCSAENMPLGSLSKDLGQYPSNDPYAALNYGSLVKQFPTFYIAAGSPQGVCSSNPTTQGLASQARAAFIQAVSTIQPLN